MVAGPAGRSMATDQLMSGSALPTATHVAFDRLAGHHRAAVRMGWRGWRSNPDALYAAWPIVPDADDRPTTIDETDWLVLTEASAAQEQRRARWVWQEIASEAVRMLPAGPIQRKCAVEASDALSVVADEDACMAAAAACRTVVRFAGKPAARLIAAMAYSGCRPPVALMADCLSGVRTVEAGGRFYVV